LELPLSKGGRVGIKGDRGIDKFSTCFLFNPPAYTQTLSPPFFKGELVTITCVSTKF